MPLPRAATALGVLLAACSLPASATAAPLNLDSIRKTAGEVIVGNTTKVLRQGGIEDAASGVLPARDAACEAAAVEQPFARFGDRANYVPVPNHGFEDGFSGWATSGRPTIVRDNEPWRVTGRASDSSAARLANGQSVTIDGLCGGLAYPTMRLFAKSAGPFGAVGLLSVRYTGTDGLLHTLPLGPFLASPQWKPTTMALTLSGLPVLTGTRLGLQITPLSGAIVIDDVYVDPFRRS